MEIKNVFVVGAGTMGNGIAQTAATSGFNVTLMDVLPQQLEKARDFLEHSIRLQPNPDAYQELGEVLESLDDQKAATRCFRRGMRLLSGRPEVRQPDAVLPARVSSG